MSGRRSDTRERIQQVALELFVEQGYDKTSLREIAERLEVTKAALYYHFKTKEDILRAVMADSAEDVDELVAWARAQTPGVETQREFLRRYAALLGGRWRLLMTFMQDNQAALRELEIQVDMARRLRAVVAFVADPEADVATRLRGVMAVVTLHIGHAPALPGLGGLSATPEEAAAAAMDLAQELISRAPLPPIGAARRDGAPS